MATSFNAGLMSAGDRSFAMASPTHRHSIELMEVSPAFQRVIELAGKVARMNAPVLLIGENGTGKELVASYVHRNSDRSSAPFVRLSCSAMSEARLETELFGDSNTAGLLHAAHGGTVFLEDVTDLPVSIQARLLRVLQEGVLPPAGSDPAREVDVRFISAINVDPFDAIRSKRLREDVYLELNVFTIRMPALRERVQDIPLLAERFLEHSWMQHHPADEPPPSLGADAIAFLSSRPWRGNLRELENVIERLVVLAEPGTVIHAGQVPIDLPPTGASIDGSPTDHVEHQSYHAARNQILAHFEKDYVSRLVAGAAGNMSRAARVANVDRTTLYRMMERNGLSRDLGELPPS